MAGTFSDVFTNESIAAEPDPVDQPTDHPQEPIEGKEDDGAADSSMGGLGDDAG